ncbi:molybdate ABC transporter substrate-binding protein [Nocardioides dilutus]
MRSFLATTLASVVALSSCASGDGDGDAGSQTSLTVYAAASLTDSFEQIGELFEAGHDGVDVELGLGGSSDLVAQIREGAPADVFASADLATMEKLTAEGLEGQDPQSFATNTLQIAVAPDNPLGIDSLADLTGPDVNLVTCAPEVPCGAAAHQVAEAAGLELAPVSEEQSVTDVLAKVTSGEADAGLVYVTDVIGASGAVLGVDFPQARSAVNTYPITTVADSDAGGLAAEFVELVLSEDGQAILRDAGFGEP